MPVPSGLPRASWRAGGSARARAGRLRSNATLPLLVLEELPAALLLVWHADVLLVRLRHARRQRLPSLEATLRTVAALWALQHR